MILMFSFRSFWLNILSTNYLNWFGKYIITESSLLDAQYGVFFSYYFLIVSFWVIFVFAVFFFLFCQEWINDAGFILDTIIYYTHLNVYNICLFFNTYSFLDWIYYQTHKYYCYTEYIAKFKFRSIFWWEPWSFDTIYSFPPFSKKFFNSPWHYYYKFRLSTWLRWHILEDRICIFVLIICLFLS
jgi:hypothetical protein